MKIPTINSIKNLYKRNSMKTLPALCVSSILLAGAAGHNPRIIKQEIKSLMNNECIIHPKDGTIVANIHHDLLPIMLERTKTNNITPQHSMPNLYCQTVH